MKSFTIFLIGAAVLVLGVFVLAGRNRDSGPSIEKAQVLLEKANQGDAEDALELARRYGFGNRDLNQDWKEARQWAERAAGLGSASAKTAVAAMQIRGLGGLADPSAGERELRAEIQGGSIEAAYVLGRLMLTPASAPDKRLEGLALVRRAARGGFHRAQYTLGCLYLSGAAALSIEKDPARAMSWFEKAARQADSDACGELGRGYLYGTGVDMNYREAYAWLCAATDADSGWEVLRVEARRKLSSFDEQDYREAVTFTRREYGPRRYHPSLAARVAEAETVF
ncbi:sel1 repeat family protein [Mesosutterella sp. OilRF-GAM-744-9]|uniref:Sel1 repeat family protein n=1 Tax=Mesosutterella porci TaxID=2915351 RepID=A0ABS9MQT7_9BURK|nr:tetratricopeptide repeat protein [Mesosutterella sp. oilRF-744-WT-GAM-9]MCG5030986.1 sel1 repeat family protein [Mesosutterella sp. oilRF-744-WT-GAM-9]